MLALVVALSLTQLPPGFESRQSGTRLSSQRQDVIDCRPPLQCQVTGNTVLRIWAPSTSTASDVVCTGCVGDSDVSGVAGSKVTSAVATATALAADPAACTTGQYVSDIAANGTLTCSTPAGGPGGSGAPVDGGFVTFSGGTTGSTNERTLTAGTNIAISTATPGQVGISVTGSVATANALAADPSDCTAGQYATTIAASGNLTCSQVAYSQVSGTPTIPSDTSGAGYWTKTAEGGLSNEVDMSALGTGIVLNTTTTGIPTIYAGTTCTSQFARSLSASGAATCASVDLETDTEATPLPVTKGGLGLTTVAVNQIPVGTETDGYTAKTLPSCSNATTSKLLYNDSTQTWSCGTDQTGGGGGVSPLILSFGGF